MRDLWLILTVLLFPACGANTFSSLEKPDIGLQATKLLEDEQPQSAIDLLLSNLGSSFRAIYDGVGETSDLTQVEADFTSEVDTLVAAGATDDVPNLVSILASAQAQLYNVDPLSIALTLSKSSSSESSSNPITLLFPILPKSTSTSVRGLDLAVILLNSIGSSATKADQLKKGIFVTASISLTVKGLDANSNGIIEPAEVLTLSEAGATALIQQLAAAAEAAAGSGDTSDSSNAGTSAQSISGIQDKIDAEPGTSKAEKLRAFITSTKN